jgi:hypothetical protein
LCNAAFRDTAAEYEIEASDTGGEAFDVSQFRPGADASFEFLL